MSTPVVAFFNNKGRVGKTSLVYHLAWMYADFGRRVVAADLDPQANLTAAFLDEDRLVELWPEDSQPYSIFGSIRPLIEGTGDIVATPHVERITEEIGLLVGDLLLSGFEDDLSGVWPKCLDGDQRAFRVISAFWRVMQAAAVNDAADVILVDLGPNLGAINRAALVAADYVVIPLSPDLFSLQGLRNLGPTLRRWRAEWSKRLGEKPAIPLELPQGNMQPVGYIVLQHSERLNRPVQAYRRWVERIPEVYRTDVLAESWPGNITVANDPHCLASLKHYHSLIPMAQEARKPIFHLKPADGAIGAHFNAVRAAYHDFEALAQTIAERTELISPA